MNKRSDFSADDEFAVKAKRLFDESVESLDGETRSRLNQGRQAALAELDASRRPWVLWAPAGGVAVAAVAALVVWSGSSQMDVPDVPEAVSDMEILLAEDSLEMLEELEFYSWMELDDDGFEI